MKILAKMYKIWKYFGKGQPHACEYCMHETARICPPPTNILSPPSRNVNPPHLALNNNFNLTKTYNPVKTAFLAVVIAPVPFFI